MQLSLTLALLFCGVSIHANPPSKRVPQYDIYLYEDIDCNGDAGELCEGYEVDNCCGRADFIFASANYALPGQVPGFNGADIRVYDRRETAEGIENCFAQIAHDDTCATSAFGIQFGGAQVNQGSETETGNTRRGKSSDAMTTSIFYMEGNRRWTIGVNSKEAQEYYSKDKEDRVRYIMMVGKLTILDRST